MEGGDRTEVFVMPMVLCFCFFVKPNEKQTVDMRAYIEQDGQRVSEVWNYVYQPN